MNGIIDKKRLHLTLFTAKFKTVSMYITACTHIGRLTVENKTFLDC